MKLGFIGCGNMGGALIGGILEHHICEASEILASTPDQACAERVRRTYKIEVTPDNRRVAKECDTLVLAIKPQFYEEVIGEIRNELSDSKIVVSIAPGKTLEWLDLQFGRPLKLVRCMPNTPAMVGEGITGVCCNKQVQKEELESICELLSGCGKTEVLPESLMDVVVSVSGSAPAYVFMFIEAMADAAVADGMPRAQAYKFASQAILGSAKMVLETGKHPGELKDMVCSPGGTTIEAVRVLEEKGFRSAVIEAMKACTSKAKGM